MVDDQFGQPTWTLDVADLIVRLVQADAPAGTWHATSTGETSWFEFARRVVERGRAAPEVVSPTDSAAFVRPAPRPAYSVLGHDRLTTTGSSRSAPGRSAGSAPPQRSLVLQQPE